MVMFEVGDMVELTRDIDVCGIPLRYVGCKCTVQSVASQETMVVRMDDGRRWWVRAKALKSMGGPW